MLRINRMIAALVLVCLSFSAIPAIAQVQVGGQCGICKRWFEGTSCPYGCQYGGGPPQPATYGVVKIYNRSSKDLSYYLHGEASNTTLKPGGWYFHYKPLPTSFRIDFDSSDASGYQKQTSILEYNVVKGRRPTEKDGRPYYLKKVVGGIGLLSGAGTTTTRPPIKRFGPQDGPDWTAIYHSGRLRYEHGDMTGARLLFQQALAMSPNNQQVKAWLDAATRGELLLKGNSAAATGNHAETIQTDRQMQEAARLEREEAARVAREEAARVAREEADRLARAKTSGMLSNLAGRFGGNSGAGGGLDFDGTSSGAAGGGLDFAGGEKPPSGQLEFERGGQGTAPVPLDVTDFDFDSQSKSGADAIAITNRLNLQHLSQRGSRDGPPAEKSDHAPTNPLDFNRVDKEWELIKPLDMVKFGELGETKATDLADARVKANRNEASRQAREDLEEAWNKLRREGQLGADESPWKKAQTDTAFKAKFNAVMQEVTDKENQRDRQANEGWYRDMARWYMWQAKKPQLEPLIEEITDRLKAEQKDAMAIHRNVFDYECHNIEKGFRDAGVLAKDESPLARAERDPAFADQWWTRTETANNRLADARMRVEEDRKKKWAIEVRRLEGVAGIAE